MNIPEMTDEQVDRIYKDWLNAPGHANGLDLICMAVAARDAQWQAQQEEAPAAEPSTPPAGERERFETDFLRRFKAPGYLGRDCDGKYEHQITQVRWESWQARAALAAQPEPAAQDIEDAERWCWYHEGDERVTVLHSESEAHGEAQQWINENCEPDEEHEYLVAPMKSGLDLLGSPGHIGETIIENINENLSDEMGAEEDPIDMPKDDIAKLGELVRQFVRSEGKVQWWTIDTKREAKHAARAATKPQGGA